MFWPYLQNRLTRPASLVALAALLPSLAVSISERSDDDQSISRKELCVRARMLIGQNPRSYVCMT